MAHSILVVIYHMLRDGTGYEDLGADYFRARHAETVKRRSIKELEKLGYKVILDAEGAMPVAVG